MGFRVYFNYVLKGENGLDVLVVEVNRLYWIDIKRFKLKTGYI